MSVRSVAMTIACAVLGVALVAAAPVVPTDATGAAAVAVDEGSAAPSPDRWALAEQATIHPGVTMVTEGSACTANFIFEWWEELPDDKKIRHVYIGYAAHCASPGSNTDTNGCLAGSLPLQTKVDIDGAARQGTLAYSSWHTMIARGEDPDTNRCRYNDFALVELHPADHSRVNPSLPHFGGPVGLGSATALGDEVYSYGNSSLRMGIEELKPKYEASLGMESGGWVHRIYAVTPGIPGDSGSGHVDGNGRAVGVTSTVQAAPLAGSNGVTDLRSALDYLTSSTSLRPKLVAGTEPFDASIP